MGVFCFCSNLKNLGNFFSLKLVTVTCALSAHGHERVHVFVGLSITIFLIVLSYNDENIGFYSCNGSEGNLSSVLRRGEGGGGD